MSVPCMHDLTYGQSSLDGLFRATLALQMAAKDVPKAILIHLYKYAPILARSP